MTRRLWLESVYVKSLCLSLNAMVRFDLLHLLSLCKFSKLLSLKHKSLLFFRFLHICPEIGFSIFYQRILRTCGRLASSAHARLQVKKRLRNSIDFWSAPVSERPGLKFNLLVAYGFGSTKTSGYDNLQGDTCKSDPLLKKTFLP